MTEPTVAEPAVAETVRRRWCEVLETPRTDDDANFFLCGGHSLLAVRLTNALRDDLGVRIPVSALFELHTLDRYATHVQDLVDASREAGA
jgi:acyl carrier protein